MELISAEQLIEILRTRCNGWGNQTQVAQNLRVNPSLVCNILAGREAMTRPIARKLGYEPVTVYEEIEEKTK